MKRRALASGQRDAHLFSDPGGIVGTAVAGVATYFILRRMRKDKPRRNDFDRYAKDGIEIGRRGD